MEYLNLTPSTINQFFNTITREGQDQIYFDDVVQVIGYLEESKFEETQQESQKHGLNLNVYEIENILKNFKDLKEVNTIKEFEEQLNGIFLVFVVDFEGQNGKGSAPNLFNELNIELLYNMIKNYPSQLEASLINKFEEKKLNHEVEKIKINVDPGDFKEGSIMQILLIKKTV